MIPRTATSSMTTHETKRRADVQRFRLYSQLVSLLVNVWIGIQLYFFVRYLDSGGEALRVPRPPGVEGWLPISSLVSLRYWWETGIVKDIHPAGLIIYVVILLVAFLFTKGFCLWVCPLGFISEILGYISNRLFRKGIKPLPPLDCPLRSLKYILLGFFFYAILIQLTAAGIEQFVYTNYNRVADILMLRFFTDIALFALGVIAGLFVLSLVVRGFWCRYLCPHGGWLSLLSFISPTRIIRNKSSCIDCAACARVCPVFVKVDRVEEVRSDECTGCLACVESCPVEKTLQIHLISRKRNFPKMRWAVILVIAFWGSLLAFKLAGPCDNSIAEFEYVRHVPAMKTSEYLHPQPDRVKGRHNEQQTRQVVF